MQWWTKPVSAPEQSDLSPLPPTDSPRDEHHTRGCGNLPGCPGPTGFHNNHTFHFLQCCNTTKCNAGPGEGRGTTWSEVWGRDRGVPGLLPLSHSLTGHPFLSRSLSLLKAPPQRRLVWEFNEATKLLPRTLYFLEFFHCSVLWSMPPGALA